MESKVVFEEKIALSAREFNQLGTKRLDDLLLKKFADKNEGRCSVHGWVIPGSLKILSRTMLQTESGRFTGDLVSWVQVEGKVIYPVDGARVRGFVLKKNKMGMFVMHEEAIQIMVPRDLHIGDEEFDKIQIGEQVEVEIKKSRFQVNDPQILSVGLFIRRIEGAAASLPAMGTVTNDKDEDEDGTAAPVSDAIAEDDVTLDDIEDDEEVEIELADLEATEETDDNTEADEDALNTEM
jgi:DNA-directed RNA polymerase subunit E'/Rpb7